MTDTPTPLEAATKAAHKALMEAGVCVAHVVTETATLAAIRAAAPILIQAGRDIAGDAIERVLREGSSDGTAWTAGFLQGTRLSAQVARGGDNE